MSSGPLSHPGNVPRPSNAEPPSYDLIHETPCSGCAGSGSVGLSDGDSDYCPDCEGAGSVPTPEGRRLLEFLGRHFYGD